MQQNAHQLILLISWSYAYYLAKGILHTKYKGMHTIPKLAAKSSKNIVFFALAC
jgi:hypothetical protein